MSDPANDAVIQISRAPAWQAVRLPLRLRIFETARRLGEASVTELAQAVGLNRTALYFHLRHLERAGLLTSRAGEPTPGRRGKRPRYYRATAGEILFHIDGDSKRELQRVGEFLKPWLAESRGVATDARAMKSSSRRVSMSWESLTDDEANRVRNLVGEIEDIVKRARNRANSMRKAPAATHHVGVVFAPVDGAMPGPEIRFRIK